MSTHAAVAITSKGKFEEIQVPTPKPGAGQVLLKIEYAAMIAFDTYQTDLGYAVAEYPLVLGFSGAGTVAEVGSDVDNLKVGDRVTAFTYQSSKSKATQVYSLQPATVCAKIPDSLALEVAATIPDNFVTAFYTLFHPGNLALPLPSTFPPAEAPPLAAEPILVYGAGAIAGLYTVQLLHISGYKNVIVTASPKHHEYLKSLGATHAFDYNSPSLAEDIAKVVGSDGKIKLAVDAITAETTLQAVAKVASPQAKIAILLPIKEGSNVRGDERMHMSVPDHLNPFPKTATVIGVRTFLYQENHWQKENLMPNVLPSLLKSGLIKPSRVRLIEQGSFKDRVATGLDLLRNNKVSGEKVVVKVTA